MCCVIGERICGISTYTSLPRASKHISMKYNSIKQNSIIAEGVIAY
jgi:hypothetical protein